MDTNSNPFAAGVARAAEQGYIGAGRRPRTGAGSRLAALEEAQTPNTPLEPMVTDKQVAFMKDLFIWRDFSSEVRPVWRDRMRSLFLDGEVHNMTRTQASAFIEYALGMPEKDRTPEVANQDEIPAGLYALPNNVLNGDQSDNDISFFRVDRPTEGKWAGYTFVTRQVSDEFLRMSRRQQDEAKQAIREFGFEAATRLYGLELGVCGVCGRTLTNAESRAGGIGPVCRQNRGW